ncbi:hypothetical protein BOW35_05020 [Solemya velum gill symbiont]|uniref:hypothetical protein n=1 Tax=Solemya velum gill symbiont TaxID=2340 RepID=UPI0009982B27|nr:hypothetical protein [Solemya velum gill symbiont]OOZ19267.1 hypothetical protein BOW29_08175 [Solemya velum gill symbiont]OOZ34417.1 hypothetical protein BOW35_05020 [Solemya velum gill symbiont]
MTSASNSVDFVRSVYCLLPSLFNVEAISSSSAQTPNLDQLARSCRRLESPPLSIGQVLQQALGLDQKNDFPSGALRYAGLGGDPGRAVWAQLQPVHFRPDRDRLLVFPLEGASAIPPQGLLDHLNSHFAEDGCHFVSLNGEWFVRFDSPLSAVTSSLSEARRKGVEEAMPHGEDARLLKRLLTEMQMLLAQMVLPGQQQALFNGFWISGLGSLESIGALQNQLQLVGDSPLLDGLRQLMGQAPVSMQEIELSRPAVVFTESPEETAIAEAETLFGHLLAGKLRKLVIADESGDSLVYKRPLVYPFWRKDGWRSLLEAEIAAGLLNEQDMM